MLKGGPKPAITTTLDLSTLPSSGPERVVAFIEAYLSAPLGEYAKRPIVLRDWQCEIIHGLYSEPRVMQSYISLPRKNGKSFLAACIALYALIADNEESPEVYIVAGDERQARIVFNMARRMLDLSPELSAVTYIFKNHIEYPHATGRLEPLSSDANLRQGLNPSLVVFDEVHVQRNDELWNAMLMGMVARRRPLLLGITTPGYDTESLAYKLHRHGLAGDDPDFYFKEFSAPTNLAYDLPSTWALANPAMGDYLHEKNLKAIIKTTTESAFRRYHLGQWTASAEAWLPSGAWDACAAPRDLKPREKVVLGFDGSYVGDSTALVAVALADNHVSVLGLWEKPEHSTDWRVPRAEVMRTFAAAFAKYRVVELQADPYGWESELQDLEREYSASVVQRFPSFSAAKMAPAVSMVYQAVLEGSLTHDGSAALGAHFANCQAKDTSQGVVITKDSKMSKRKIDGAVATILAFHRVNLLSQKRGKRVMSY